METQLTHRAHYHRESVSVFFISARVYQCSLDFLLLLFNVNGAQCTFYSGDER